MINTRTAHLESTWPTDLPWNRPCGAKTEGVINLAAKGGISEFLDLYSEVVEAQAMKLKKTCEVPTIGYAADITQEDQLVEEEIHGDIHLLRNNG